MPIQSLATLLGIYPRSTDLLSVDWLTVKGIIGSCDGNGDPGKKALPQFQTLNPQYPQVLQLGVMTWRIKSVGEYMPRNPWGAGVYRGALALPWYSEVVKKVWRETSRRDFH